MKIEFSGLTAVSSETFSVNFEARVDGRQVVCSATAEAISLVAGGAGHGDMQQLFLAHKQVFFRVAERLIREGRQPPIRVAIADISA